MGTDTLKLTVLFEEPFWIGLLERWEGGRYAACKITFGAEPRDCEIYDFLLGNWKRLRFSPSIAAGKTVEKRLNPKRMLRQSHRATVPSGIGTKAQQALQLQREQSQTVRKETNRARREEERDRQFALRREKRKEKHRGH